MNINAISNFMKCVKLAKLNDKIPFFEDEAYSNSLNNIYHSDNIIVSNIFLNFLFKFNVLQIESDNISVNTIEDFAYVKKYTNMVRHLTSIYDVTFWSRLTTLTDPAKKIQYKIRLTKTPFICTSAWCKCYELISRFNFESVLINCVKKHDKINTWHLCEAPGAFVSAMGYYLQLKGLLPYWTWMASSLNPYYQTKINGVVYDTRLSDISFNNWFYCADGSGNICDFDNIKSIISNAHSSKYPISLVTADGSFDCSKDFGNQEISVVYLKFCELITALHILDQEGVFVQKYFTLFEEKTRSIIFIIRYFFDQVFLCKPLTSKRGNSEIYVIAKGYRKPNPSILENLLLLTKLSLDSFINQNIIPLEIIPLSFLSELLLSAKIFSMMQQTAIQQNIFLSDQHLSFQHINQISKFRSEPYFTIFNTFTNFLKSQGDHKKKTPFCL
ncbi:Cap-specific mRNA (nucleoside-2'-O-)-methyltransferase 1, partial [Intoshia linei]